ncbi:MAG: hypothetical protein KGL12_02800 [Rhodospirillales bacterium]|nr:hypothetical protein [Rhodospirillales bacterium]
MTRKSLVLIWGFGILLAILLNAIGPEHVLASLLNAAAAFDAALARMLSHLAASLAHWVRAFAIALFVVFMVLGIIARRQGRQKSGPLVLGALIFLALAYDVLGADLFAPDMRWLLALLLALAGALAMTRKLLAPPPAGARVGPWPKA